MEIDLFELIAAVFGAASVWLLARRNILAFPLGIVNVAMYVVIFYNARFYSDMILQVVYILLQIQGWYAWTRGEKAYDERIAIHRFTPKHWLLSGALIVAGTACIGFLMSQYTDASLPWLDAGTTSVSLVAQFWLNKKYLENWVLWIFVDFVYLYQYGVKELYITMVLYAVFLLLAVSGYLNWKKQEVAAHD
jgi:nicotinamide mononucleotide transporter